MRTSLGLFAVQDIMGGGPQSLVDTCVAAEKSGIDQVVFTDHVIMGENTDKYPFGDFPVPYEYPWYEPLVMLSAVAAVTKTIALSTGILITPLRPAALLAKMTATLDVLSNGRLELGVGVGWQKEEYLAQAQDFDSRWEQFDEQLAALKTLWSDMPASFSGSGLEFDRLYSSPLPASKIPLLFGVAPTEKNCQRIAEQGDGWIPIKRDPVWIAEGVEKLRAAFQKVGRDPAELIVRGQCPVTFDEQGKGILAKSLECIDAMRDAGVTDLEFMACVFVQQPDEMPEFLQTIGALEV